MSLPPSVDIKLDSTILEYWRARAAQHTHDSYAGVPLSKFPEDLRVYEHLLWESRANVVIEIGAHYGGSALWFRDRLAANVAYGRIGNPLVVSIELDAALAREHITAAGPDGIQLLEADVRDGGLPDRVASLLPPGSRCFVVEDSAHVYDTTFAALTGFSRFVPDGGFFVVEDGCVDIDDLRIDPNWPRGVLPALHKWLESSAAAGFVVRNDLELYGVTCHPGGFLQRTSVPDPAATVG